MDLFNVIPDAVLLVDQAGTIVLANQFACKLFGYTQEEIVAQSIDLLVPSELREFHATPRANFVAGPQKRPTGERDPVGLRKDGSEIHLEISLGPFEYGEQLVTCAVLRDVTKNRSMQSALRDAEALVRLLLDSTFEAIYGLDMQGNATFCNRACLELLGYHQAKDLLGKNMHDLIHHTRRDGSAYPLQQCRIYEAFIEGVGMHAKDEVFWKADGTSFPVEYRSIPLFHENDLVGSVVTFLDITEHQHIEDELRGKQEELNHVARMSTLGEMAAGLAHELNQPLTAISALADGALLRIERGALPQEDFVNVCQRVAGDAHRAGEIIQRLRNFVRKRKTEHQTIDINPLVADVMDFVDSEMRQMSVSVTPVFADDLPQVEVDPIEIQQVIVNLIRNATDSLLLLPPDDRCIAVKTCWNNDAVEVIVSDTGGGIAQGNVNQIFEPFYTSKKDGIGIGLGICKSIIEAHQGKIWVGNNSIKGASIHFSLPAESL